MDIEVVPNIIIILLPQFIFYISFSNYLKLFTDVYLINYDSCDKVLLFLAKKLL